MASLTWVPYSGGDTPHNMVTGGKRYNNEPLYVCRGALNDLTIPGKFACVANKAYLPYGGDENVVSSCELLTCDKPDLVHWVAATDGQVPDGAITAGFDGDASDFYIGRAEQSDELLPGRVSKAHKCCFVCTRGKEWSVSQYEVLVVKSFHSLTASHTP
eukprot:TRINITY_DN1951_c0_g1_i1.p1 TRINITY_DN1951_c0_g1~~TRINITY_DN1951_c0_g1_i1.p1  ORF type:complete len:159 (-),score=20.91 TRINITY_DN1951_c0_g1_i1:136-612(-)